RNAYFNANSNSYGQSHSQSNTDWNANRNPYRNTDNNSNAQQHAENHSHTESSPKSKDATYRTTAPDARTDSIIATPHGMAAAHLASSHNTGADSVLTTSYSGTATLVRSPTSLPGKLSVCESSANRRS